MAVTVTSIPASPFHHLREDGATETVCGRLGPFHTPGVPMPPCPSCDDRHNGRPPGTTPYGGLWNPPTPYGRGRAAQTRQKPARR